MIVSMAAMMGSGMVARSIPYQPGTFGAKQLAWAAHCAILGAVIAPICFVGGNFWAPIKRKDIIIFPSIEFQDPF